MASNLPLDGIRVAAFTHFAAGPIAAQYLGALGADVIKVESPRRDLNRYAVRDPDDALDGLSPYFVCTNRNQRAIALDLKSAGGQEAAKKLIASSDVLLENYRPGVMDRLGLGYEDVRKLKENIIFCSFSAFDPDGSARDRPGQDLLLQAQSGLATLSGDADGPPVPVGAYVIDGFTAMQGVIGIVSALLHRDKTGQGQRVGADMMSTALYMMKQEASFVMNGGNMSERSRAGIAHTNQSAPYGIYPTTDGAIAISVFGGVEAVRKLAGALDIEREVDPYLSERGLAVERDTIASAIAAKLVALTTSDALDVVTRTGAWATRVRSLEEAIADPAIQETDLVQQYDDSFVGKHRAITEPLRMSETPLRRDQPVPDFAEHTREVLDELGYDESTIGSLITNGVAIAKN